ncbi:AAA family ATPase [Rhodopseudomonas sp. HC1]|uniref:AAA family ATPase n=1 Tax=Rhodopseudomonas infernalis TaxID=2897386 RepID=UPI001EE902F7|nr:AAA family ATPase [Rhodopseudomonas infernalis]MCG6203345.1 AAA family ATPase [Rhodopseudomonas infernalis]
MNRRVVISGCSGGGKSSLLAELKARGHRVIEEPGRRIIAEETAGCSKALPWVDLPAFLCRAITMALSDHANAAEHDGWTFFDRGLIDPVSALQALTGEELLCSLGTAHRYHSLMFMAPPWPEIYVADEDRRHDFETAVAEYERLITSYPALDYEVLPLPKTTTAARADFVLSLLGISSFPT